MDTIYTARLHGFLDENRTNNVHSLTEENILSLLIVLGSSLSLVALTFAFITYSLFSDLRNLSGTTLMNLLSALFMTQLLYVIGVGEILDSELCIALASALQYTRLCVFVWMLLMSHNMYMQYKTGLHLVPTTDTNIGRNFVRYSLFGWGLPCILLVASVLLQYSDKQNGGILYSQQSEIKGQQRTCWFLDQNAFVYGSVMPSALMACVTLYYLFRSAVLSSYIMGMQPDKRARDKLKRKRTVQIILFVKITLVISICLILTTAANLIKSDLLWFSYHIFQGLQGILIALLVTCNCQVLKLYTKRLKIRASRHVSSYVGEPSSSKFCKSTSLQLLTWDPPTDIV